MNDTLSKPFDADTLRHVILNLLQPIKSHLDLVDDIPASDELQIDLSYLNRVGHGNPAFIQTMFHSFVDSVKAAAADMLTALDVDDRKSIGEAAHKLKFALGVVGVTALKDTVAFLEGQGKAEGSVVEWAAYRHAVIRFVGQLDFLQKETIKLL